MNLRVFFSKLAIRHPLPPTIRHKGVYLALNSTYNKHKLYKTFDYWSRHMLNFLEKSLGIVFQPHFVHDFSRKMFLIFYELTKSHCLITFTSWDNWLNLTVWLPLLPEINDYISLSDYLYFLRYWPMCLAIVCFLVCDSYILKITLSF